MEKFKITAEQAGQVIKDDGSFDYDVLGQIISDKEKTAIADYEKKNLDGTPNPDGGKGGDEKKSTAEKIAEKMFSGKKQENNILSHYLGGK